MNLMNVLASNTPTQYEIKCYLFILVCVCVIVIILNYW